MRPFAGAVFLVFLLWSSWVFGQGDSYRVAYVNVPWILNNSPQVQAVEAALQKSFEPREVELRDRQSKLDAIEQKLRNVDGSLSDEELRRLERELVSGQRRLKILEQEFQEDVALRKGEEINKLRRQISEVISSLAKEEGIDMVFETAVVYVSDRADISAKVLERLESGHSRLNGAKGISGNNANTTGTGN
jgi:outer membrane protein